MPRKPASVDAAIKAQALSPPPERLTREDLEEIANSLPEQDRETFRACYWNDFIERNEADIATWQQDTLYQLAKTDEEQRRLLADIADHLRQGGKFAKPVLTIQEAAEMLGYTPKALQNRISAEKRRLGRLPEFVVDAGGKTKRLIKRDPFVLWLTERRRGRGRPSKAL